MRGDIPLYAVCEELVYIIKWQNHSAKANRLEPCDGRTLLAAHALSLLYIYTRTTRAFMRQV